MCEFWPEFKRRKLLAQKTTKGSLNVEISTTQKGSSIHKNSPSLVVFFKFCYVLCNYFWRFHLSDGLKFRKIKILSGAPDVRYEFALNLLLLAHFRRTSQSVVPK